MINEVSAARWTNRSQQQGSFVELVGLPDTPLKGLVLLALGEEDGGAILALPLTGSIDSNGFYVVGNITGAGNHNLLMPSYGPLHTHGCVDSTRLCLTLAQIWVFKLVIETWFGMAWFDFAQP